jgi:hypothetical protein
MGRPVFYLLRERPTLSDASRVALSAEGEEMRKLGLCIIASLIYFFIFTTSSFACVGARPMSMGGAFIGVADDASTTYWNPAGLDQRTGEREAVTEEVLDELEGVELTYTPTLYNRDEYNYDDFVAFVFPLKIKDYDLGKMGLSFINTGYKFEWDFPAVGPDPAYTLTFERVEGWYWLSYGKHILGGLSLGTNLGYHGVKEEWEVSVPGIGSDSISDVDGFFALDVSALYKIGRFSLGVLYQNANEPSEEIWGVKTKYIRNLRPGVAFRPDDDTVIAVDMYDALAETKDYPGSVAQDIRVGLERWFDLPPESPKWIGERLAIRLGGYHVNRASRAYTFGFGLKGTDWDVEQPWFKSAEIDYCLLYWQDSGEYTHQLGITFDF